MIPPGAVGFAIGLITAVFLILILNISGFSFLRKIGTYSKRREVLSSAIKRRLAQGPNIVAVGGGTGLSALLRGLKSFTRNITAVVAVTDEGGSSGRLRIEWGVLPPGDVRNCIVALAENDNALRRILDFRFDRGELAGHSLGNLMLVAVTELCGDFRLAVEEMNNLLAIRGRVLPVTTDHVVLAGETNDKKIVHGELDISKNGKNLNEIWLEPEDAKPVKEILEAIDESDLIVLGPGSLFTSVIPNLLIQEFAERIRFSKTPKIYVCNLMTQPNETEGMDIVKHVEWICGALGSVPDYVLVNRAPIPEKLIARYKKEGALPLLLDRHQAGKIKGMGCAIIEGEFVEVTKDNVVRHDSQKLAEILHRQCRMIYKD